MQVERPQEINAQIEKLLSEGTVEELRSERGQFLRLFFTTDEVSRAINLPMGEVVDFDGTTCKWCRGDMRYTQCGKCHGTFDSLPKGQELLSIRNEREKEEREGAALMRKRLERDNSIKSFWNRLWGHNASY